MGGQEFIEILKRRAYPIVHIDGYLFFGFVKSVITYGRYFGERPDGFVFDYYVEILDIVGLVAEDYSAFDTFLTVEAAVFVEFETTLYGVFLSACIDDFEQYGLFVSQFNVFGIDTDNVLAFRVVINDVRRVFVSVDFHAFHFADGRVNLYVGFHIRTGTVTVFVEGGEIQRNGITPSAACGRSIVILAAYVNLNLVRTSAAVVMVAQSVVGVIAVSVGVVNVTPDNFVEVGTNVIFGRIGSEFPESVVPTAGRDGDQIFSAVHFNAYHRCVPADGIRIVVIFKDIVDIAFVVSVDGKRIAVSEVNVGNFHLIDDDSHTA